MAGPTQAHPQSAFTHLSQHGPQAIHQNPQEAVALALLTPQSLSKAIEAAQAPLLAQLAELQKQIRTLGLKRENSDEPPPLVPALAHHSSGPYHARCEIQELDDSASDVSQLDNVTSNSGGAMRTPSPPNPTAPQAARYGSLPRSQSLPSSGNLSANGQAQQAAQAQAPAPAPAPAPAQAPAPAANARAAKDAAGEWLKNECATLAQKFANKEDLTTLFQACNSFHDGFTERVQAHIRINIPDEVRDDFNNNVALISKYLGNNKAADPKVLPMLGAYLGYLNELCKKHPELQTLSTHLSTLESAVKNNSPKDTDTPNPVEQQLTDANTRLESRLNDNGNAAGPQAATARQPTAGRGRNTPTSVSAKIQRDEKAINATLDGAIGSAPADSTDTRELLQGTKKLTTHLIDIAKSLTGCTQPSAQDKTTTVQKNLKELHQTYSKLMKTDDPTLDAKQHERLISALNKDEVLIRRIEQQSDTTIPSDETILDTATRTSKLAVRLAKFIIQEQLDSIQAKSKAIENDKNQLIEGTLAARSRNQALPTEPLKQIQHINTHLEKNLFKQIGMVVAGTKIESTIELQHIKGNPFEMKLGMKHVRPREYLRTACQAGEQLKALSAGKNIPAEGPIHLEHLPTPTLPLFRGEEGARNWQSVKDAIRSASASPEARERKRLALQIVGAWATQQALSNNEKLGLYSAVHDQLEASTTLFGLCPADVTQWSLNTRESILDFHAQLTPPKRSAKELVEQGYGSNTYKNDVSAFTLNPTSRQGIFTEAMIKVSGLMGETPQRGLVPLGSRTRRAAHNLPLLMEQTNENSIHEQLGFKPNPNASGQFLFNESAGHNELMDQLVLAATAHNDITIISEPEEPGVSRGSLRNRIIEQNKHQIRAALKNHRMDGLTAMSDALIHIGQTIRPAVSEHLKTVKNRLNQGEKVTDDQLQQLIKQIIVTTDAQAAQSSNFNMEKLIDAAEELKAADTVERQVKARGDLAHALNNIEAAWAGSDQNKKTSWESKDQRSFGDKWVLGANPIKSMPYVNRVPLLGPAAASVAWLAKGSVLFPLATIVSIGQSMAPAVKKGVISTFKEL